MSLHTSIKSYRRANPTYLFFSSSCIRSSFIWAPLLTPIPFWEEKLGDSGVRAVCVLALQHLRTPNLSDHSRTDFPKIVFYVFCFPGPPRFFRSVVLVAIMLALSFSRMLIAGRFLVGTGIGLAAMSVPVCMTQLPFYDLPSSFSFSFLVFLFFFPSQSEFFWNSFKTYRVLCCWSRVLL